MFQLSPRQVFLIDGLGALLSAFLLGIVLVQFESIFGIPPSALYILAIIPCFFAWYDWYCYRLKGTELAPYLKGMAWMNISYCILSLSFAFYHIESITTLGWLYISGEIIIVLFLAAMELKVARQ